MREKAGRGISYREQIDLKELETLANEPQGRWLEMTTNHEQVEKMILKATLGPGEERRFHLQMGKAWDPKSTNPYSGVHSSSLGPKYDWEGGVGFLAPEGQSGVVVDWVDIVDTYTGQITRINYP